MYTTIVVGEQDHLAARNSDCGVDLCRLARILYRQILDRYAEVCRSIGSCGSSRFDDDDLIAVRHPSNHAGKTIGKEVWIAVGGNDY
jgi:hypothetical protein